MASLRALFLGAAATAAVVATACSRDEAGSPNADGAAPSASDGGQGQPPGVEPGVDAGPEPTFDNGGRTCTGKTRSAAPDVTDAPQVPAGVVAAQGFTIEAIARVPGARHVAALSNGDLLVGSTGANVMLVPHADAVKAGAPTIFAALSAEAPVHGVTFHEPSCTVFVATQLGIYRIPYSDAQSTGELGTAIARVRPGGAEGHNTTSVAVAGAYLYAGIGSSCNACTETDPTRATIQRMNLDGTGMTTYAKRIRNPIALATNPVTRTLWAGNAGQDGLPLGHPYELFDAVTAHPAVADYGWPDCEENQNAYGSGADCSGAVTPRVVLPAYSTLVGAVFYPTNPTGPRAFPADFRGSALVAARGAWHETPGGGYYSAPRVVHIPMNGDVPKTAVDWADPTKQWSNLVSGFETADRKTRVGRPTGIAVGPDGSVFVADDQAGLVYRIRPAS